MDKYQGLSIAVCGSDHAGGQTIPGDYSLIHEDEQFYIMAVSAGGNDSRYFRSYLGVRYAAEAALNSLKVFASSVTGGMLFEDDRRQERMIRQLEGSIIVGWGDKVRRHLANNPFLPEEIDAVEDDRYRDGYRKGNNLEYAYRANIMAAIVARDYCLVIRNGNGQCTVAGINRQLDEPVPWNEKCTDTYSTSMCERTALQDFRYYCVKTVPAAVFLVTDGMCGCFEDPNEYHTYIEQLIQRALRNSGDAKEYLKVNLLELSRKGSHGDMCLAGVWCPSSLRTVASSDGEREQKEKEEKQHQEEERRRQEEEKQRREQEEADRLRRQQEEEAQRRREQEEADRFRREQEEQERRRREQEEADRLREQQNKVVPITEPGQKVGKKPPVILLAAAAVAGAVFFLAGSGGSGKDETTGVITTKAETSLEDNLETEATIDEKESESESIRQSQEELESIKESVREELEREKKTAEETSEIPITETETTEETAEEATEEITTAPPATTAPPRTTAAPRQTTAAPPPTTAAPPPTTAAPPPTTAAPPPTTAAPPPETAPPQTAPPTPETPPPPPQTAPPETAGGGDGGIDSALQMWRGTQ